MSKCMYEHMHCSHPVMFACLFMVYVGAHLHCANLDADMWPF